MPHTLTPEIIEAMRNDYAAGFPIAVIIAKYKIQRRTLYHWVDGGGKINGVPRLPPFANIE